MHIKYLYTKCAQRGVVSRQQNGMHAALGDVGLSARKRQTEPQLQAHARNVQQSTNASRNANPLLIIFPYKNAFIIFIAAIVKEMIRYFTVIKKGIATSEMQMRSYNIGTYEQAIYICKVCILYAKYCSTFRSIVLKS